MNAAFIVTWSRPFPGREKKALDYGVEVNEYWGKLAADGKCTPPEMFFLPNGQGFWMVKGDREELYKLFWSDVSQTLLTKGEYLFGDFKHAIAVTGTAADEFLFRYTEVGTELGYI